MPTPTTGKKLPKGKPISSVPNVCAKQSTVTLRSGHKKEDRGVCILKLRPGKLDLGAGQLRMHSQTQQRTLHGSPSVGSFDQCRIKGFFKDFS
jgi:hypothetical protein